jgi:tetratricopeptide (TPR) repeat protein
MLSQSPSARRIAHKALAVAGLLVCLWGVWSAGRAGLSRLLSKYAVATTATRAPLLSPADQAVSLAPNDPEAHFSRALVLSSLGRQPEAVAEYERATALRPRDYYLWMILGSSRDQAEDEKGALAALNEAVRLAPFYAQPRWQFGNVLFRAGQADEGFREMRAAALSDQTFLPNMIDLAWGASNKDAAATERLVQSESKHWRVALAHFFARKGEPAAALNLYRAAGTLTDQDRQTLIQELLSAKGYAEAYEVWAAGAASSNDKAQPGGLSQITNGSFEGQLKLDETGFGWQFVRGVSTLKFSLDTIEPRAGAHSLRLDWSGDSPPAAPVTSQLVIVEPTTRYRLTFAARTQEIVSGALPLVAVVDKSSTDNRSLAQSKPLAKGSSNWQDYSLDFTTGNETRAVLIGLQRETCASESCPIFGKLWLDNFSLQKL